MFSIRMTLLSYLLIYDYFYIANIFKSLLVDPHLNTMRNLNAFAMVEIYTLLCLFIYVLVCAEFHENKPHAIKTQAYHCFCITDNGNVNETLRSAICYENVLRFIPVTKLIQKLGLGEESA